MDERTTTGILTEDGNLMADVAQDYRQEIAHSDRRTFVNSADFFLKVIFDGIRRFDDQVALTEFHARDSKV